MLCLGSVPGFAQAAPDHGAAVFGRSCAGCHGADGKGSDRGPSIATMPTTIARSDADLIGIVHNGISGKGMPPFSFLGDDAIKDVVQHLRALQGVTAGAVEAPMTGNAEAGRALFFGKAGCSTCHMVKGEGGFIASDMTAYGQSRGVEAIKRAIVSPDAEVPREARVVEVKTKDGGKLVGVLRSEDNLNLAVQTEDGRYHFLTRDSLADVTYTGHSLMPLDYGTRLSATELDDLAAFLIVTGKSTPAETVAKKRRGGELRMMLGLGGCCAAYRRPRWDRARRGLWMSSRVICCRKEIRDNWVSYNGDYTGKRYSSLTEVTPANVKQLGAKWIFHTKNAGVLQVTPVVVAGVMFVTGSNDAYALDAKTGKQLWHHARGVSTGLIDDASGHINRGVAVLGNRLYMETDNAHLLCLDARSGNVIWDVLYATGNKNFGATSAPLIVKDKVLVGTSGGDDGVRGFVAAFDVATGKEVLAVLDDSGAWVRKGRRAGRGICYLHGGGTTWMPGDVRSGAEYDLLGDGESFAGLRWECAAGG